MVLSKLALSCLETNTYFANDILFSRMVTSKKSRYDKIHRLYRNARKYSRKFYEYTKMSVDTFDYIVEKVENELKMEKISGLSAGERVFLTLRFLSVMSCGKLAEKHGLGRSTVSVVIYDTLRAIWKALLNLHMPKLTTELLRNTSSEFYIKWNFPNCIGCVAAKHLYVNPNKKSENATIMLQGIADADYKFIAIEVMTETEDDYSGIMKSKLLPKISSFAPQAQNLPYSNISLPHVLIGDEEYPLRPYLMRPYPSRNIDKKKMFFNNCLRRPGVVIYKTFKLLTAKWRILSRPIQTNLDHAILITKVACLLHNVIRDMDGDRDGEFHELIGNLTLMQPLVMHGIRSKRNNRYSAEANIVRGQYTNYFLARNAE